MTYLEAIQARHAEQVNKGDALFRAVVAMVHAGNALEGDQLGRAVETFPPDKVLLMLAESGHSIDDLTAAIGRASE